MKRTVAIMQARTGSNRLPSKILKPLYDDVSLLAYQCRRFRKIEGVDELIVATTDQSKDDIIVDACEREGVRVARGPEEDVLSRFLIAADMSVASTIVRITSDSPLRDPAVIARCVAEHHHHGAEYTRPAPDSLPQGMRAEVIQTGVLLQLHESPEITARDREHVTLHVREHPEAFRRHEVDFPEDVRRPGFNLSVDTQDDLEFVQRIYESLTAREAEISTYNICRLLDELSVHAELFSNLAS